MNVDGFETVFWFNEKQGKSMVCLNKWPSTSIVPLFYLNSVVVFQASSCIIVGDL